MDFPKYFLANQLFIKCFIKKCPSSSNISYFNMLKNFGFFCWFGWKVAREYLQIHSDWFRWHQASDPTAGLGNFLQFIHSLPSVLNLASWYPLWHWQPPRYWIVQREALPHVTQSTVMLCQFKDSVHVFLELLGHSEAWCLATLEIRVHEWIQISRICSAAKRYLRKRDAGCIALLIWKKTLAGVLNWAAYSSFS